MGYRRFPFAPGEWYHLYSRGIDKRKIFLDERDLMRFQKLLYLANDTQPINFQELGDISDEEMYALPRHKTIVSIAAYCLMSNHPHLVVQEKEEGGITAFMHKIGTAYTGYFNVKYDRIGNLMVKPFRSKHIAKDDYFHYLIQYVHLNPAEIFEPDWKLGIVNNLELLEQRLRSYAYSSMPDYFGVERPMRSILDKEAFAMALDRLPSMNKLLNEAAEYYDLVDKDFERPRGRPRKK